MLIAALISAVLLLVLPQSALDAVPTEVWAWGTFLVTFALFRHQQILATRSGENPWATVGPLLSGWLFVRYGLGAITIFYWDQYPWILPHIGQRYLQGSGARLHLQSGCIIAILGAVGFYASLRFNTAAISNMLPHVSWPVDLRRYQRNALLYAPIGLFILLYLKPTLPLSIQFAVSLFAIVTYALLVMISYWWFSAATPGDRMKWMMATLSICALIGIFGLSTNQVGQVFVPLMMVAFGYVLARGRMPWGVIATVAVAMFLFVAPFLTVFKYTSNSTMSESIGDRVQETRDRMETISYLGGLELAVDRFVARLALIEFPCRFAAYYPSLFEHAYGHSFFVEFGNIIPRLLWPEKPDMDSELNRYSAAIGIIKEGAGTSAVFDALAEYHVNFGPLGVLVFAALHGLYLKVLYEWLITQFDWLTGMSVHLMLFMNNFDFFGVGVQVATHLKVLPVIIVLLYFLGRETRLKSLRNVNQYA